MYTGQIVQCANKHYFIAEIYKSDVHGPEIDCPILNAYFIGIEWQNFPLMYSFINLKVLTKCFLCVTYFSSLHGFICEQNKQNSCSYSPYISVEKTEKREDEVRYIVC